MKKYRLNDTFFAGANSSALHMLTTGQVTTAGENVTMLTVHSFADNNNIESAPLAVISEKNVNNETPYTVKLSQYIRVGTVVVVKFTVAALPLVPQIMDELCDYWEYATQFENKTIAWGNSRVQKTDFSDPVADAQANAGVTVLTYESPKQLRNTPNPNQGPIVGIDDRPVAMMVKPNALVRPSGNLLK